MQTTVKVGEVYGGLKIASIARNPNEKTKKNYKLLVECIHCQKLVYRDRSNVKSASLKSCGCRKSIQPKKRRSKYGD